MTLRRQIRIMDLHDDAATLAAYDHAHAIGQTPAKVLDAQHRNGIADMEIFRVGNRLVMLMDVTADFDPQALDAEAAVQAVISNWHRRMGALQRAPFADGVAWPEAQRVFRQSDHMTKKESA